MPCLGKSVLFFERQFLSNEGNNYSSDAWLFWEGVNGGWFQINFPLHKMLWGRYLFLPLFIDEEAELSGEWAGQWLGFRAPSLDTCGWAGSAFFISRSAVSAQPFLSVAAAPILPWCPCLLLMPQACLPPRGHSSVPAAARMRRAQRSPEISFNLQPVLWLFCKRALLSCRHREAQGHRRSGSQRMQTKPGLMRQLEANDLTCNL